MMFMHYYINVLDNLNAFNNNIYYTISSANKKKVHQTGLNLEEINYKDVSLKRPSY